MRISIQQLRRIIKEEVQTQSRKRRLQEATRSQQNLTKDLLQLPIGGTLDLETFGGGDYEPGDITITRVDDGDLQSGYDIDEDETPIPLFTLTYHGDHHDDYYRGYHDEDDEEEYQEQDTEDETSTPMTLDDLLPAIGDFAY